MSRIPRPLAALAPLCVLASLAHAQTGVELAPVVVTGQKNPDQSTLTQPDLPTARQRLATVPGGAEVVDAATYDSGRVSNLSDALGNATGVYVQPRFGAEESRISIRGSGLQRTFHGRGLKLMQDGVPLNLADGSFDFQAIEPLSARYIEVWRGANALQYGAATLGGAVNFVSPNGYNADLVRVRGEAGSFGYGRVQVATGDVNDKLDHHVSASGFRQDGFRDHAQQSTGRLSANLGYQLADNLETRFYLGHVNSDSELPGSLTRAQLESDPRQAAVGNITGDQHRDIRWTRLSNKTVWQDGPQRVEGFVFLSDKNLHHPIFQVIDQHNQDVGLEVRYVRDDGRNRLTAGIAPSRGVTDEDRYLNVGGRSGARTNASKQTASNVEVYVEDQYLVRPDVALIVGLQHVESTRRLEDRFVVGGVDEGFDQHYSGTNPKLGVRWDLSKAVQVYANVSRSMEPPTFSELAGGLTPTLNAAQRADTFEVGTRGRWNGLVWDTSFYEARVKDELLQIAVNSAGASTTVNADRTLHRGIELGVSGEALRRPGGHVEWSANALWNHFRFRDDAVYGNNALPGIPKYFGRAQAGWRFAQGTLLALHAEGSSGYPIDFTNSFGAKRYVIWGLRASGDVVKGLSWFVDGRNLSDKHYASATGVVRNAGGADTAQFMPGDGRAVYAGLDWKFR